MFCFHVTYFQTSKNVERIMVVVVKYVLTNLVHTNADVRRDTNFYRTRKHAKVK